MKRGTFVTLLTMTLVLSTVQLAGCGALVGRPPGQKELSPATALPDVSGLTWIGSDRFLAVHDAKTPKEDDLPRVSVLRLPSDTEGLLWEPLHVDFPGENSDDLESVARIPGTPYALLVESTKHQKTKPFARRIFLVTPRLAAVDIHEVIVWPVETHNVEGTAVARIGDQFLFVYAERAQDQGSTSINYAELWLRPLRLGTFRSAGEFASPEPTGKGVRQVSSMEIDSAGVIHVASAKDPGDDGGPFRSAAYAIGEAVEEDGEAKVVLYDQPQQIAILDGLKAESLAVRELPRQPTEFFVGCDDEEYGGSMLLFFQK